uniref:Uncharacterized protein n=1 Tax=Sus scrofa TaxID=9823 RepID=A0A8D1R886_PIG
MAAKTVGSLSAESSASFTTGAFTVGNDLISEESESSHWKICLMSAMNVGNPLAAHLISFNTRDFTIVNGLRYAGIFLKNTGEFTEEKGLMNAMNVGKPLTTNPNSFTTRDNTLEECIISVMNMKSPLATNPTSLNTREFTLKKDVMNAVNVGSPLYTVLALSDTREFTLEKSLMSAVNVGKPLDKFYLFLFIYLFCLFLPFLGPHPQHVEVPRLGV